LATVTMNLWVVPCVVGRRRLVRVVAEAEETASVDAIRSGAMMKATKAFIDRFVATCVTSTGYS
jgi:hypothetical protein